MASSSKEWPKVMSSHHRDRECGPCFLCKKKQPRYDHFCSLSSGEQRFLQQHLESDIPNSTCLCRAHIKEAKRNRSDPEYIPVWKRSSLLQDTQSVCTYSNCAATLREKIIIPSAETQAIFAQLLNVQGSVALCETHYHSLYRQLHKPNSCAGCGANPKAREGAFIRHSPDAITVSEYLCERTGCDLSLTPTDTLCKSCYDMHLVILNHIEQLSNEPKTKLKSDITEWNEKLADENTNELTRAILATVLFVGKKIQKDRAILLPHAVTVFLENYSHDDDDFYLELGDGRVKFSSRWLLHQLIIHLQPYIKFKCVVKKLGTLIYSCTSDPLKCLSLALHDSCADTPFNLDVSQSQLTTDRQKNVLREAGDIINDIVHDTIRDQKQKKIDLTTFDLRECIGSTSEVLWDFISSCTRSVRERTGRPYSSDNHIRNVRRFFIISQLLFSTNPSCATTLHHLVADTIEVNGGSRQLIRVMNRLGVSVASDTHDRLVTEVAEKQQLKSLWCDLSPSIFTVASTDNIDFLQSHAAVYCGDQSRSYHATTVQVVQPVPSLTCTGEKATTQDPTRAVASQPVPLLTGTGTTQDPTNGSSAVASDTLKTPSIQHLSKRLLSNSPSNSPHKHGKVGPKRRRRRTMEIFPKQVNEVRHEIANSTNYQRYRSLQLSQFSESGDSKTRLFKETFAYLLQKLTMQDTEVLKPLREFILPTSAQLSDHNPSSIYYMEILDENADSQSTMAEVSELLLEKLLVESQKWVVLVGDGKTYDHLKKVKRGQLLKNCLSFLATGIF
ncbi:hypothetical protein SPBRAN_865 [uncultured Candidatus Thioglobus sp.]|nr:hypothetical protein SPBRAN_865 [uncultured Candidatus Thioglobus sp.]